MGLIINRPPPSIKQALAEFAAKLKKDKRTLMLLHKENGSAYTVKSYDPNTGRAVLYTGFKRKTINPLIADRECELYTFYWR